MKTTFPFKSGDILFLHANGLLDRCINWFQSLKNNSPRSSRTHTAIVLDSIGTLFETTSTFTKCRNIADMYAGSTIEVIRWSKMTDEKSMIGWQSVKHQSGKLYPYYRLFIQAVGLEKFVHFDAMECCVLAAKFLKSAGYPLKMDNIWGYDTEALGIELCKNSECQTVFYGSLRSSNYITD